VVVLGSLIVIIKMGVAQLINNQPSSFGSKVHCHTSRAQQVGIKPALPPMQAVALPTTPQIIWEFAPEDILGYDRICKDM
jgi:hypothetical protein